MLTAFKARPIVELKQRDKSKIESVLTYGDRLLVGLNTGSLRIYRVNEPISPVKKQPNTSDSESTPNKQNSVDLLREEEKFSRKPVTQLAIIKEANVLISLSDGFVSIHDLQSYQLQERLERTRGASSFAATSNIIKDPSTGIPSIVSRLAVAVKRKIYMWSWQDMELLELEESGGELTFVSTVKSLTWASATKIVVGMDPGFVLADVESGELANINKQGELGESSDAQTGLRFGAVNSSGMGYMGMGSWVPKPLATKLQEGQLLLAKDVNTLFIDDKGQPLEKRQIPWASAPESLAYSYPYMLALQPLAKGGIEVRSPETLSLLQSVPLANASSIHVPQPNISLAHAGKGFLVASDRVIWRMVGLDYDTQVDELVQAGFYDEAISLLGMLEDTLLEDKIGSLRNIKMMKARGLFDLQRYRDSLDIFSEASAPPEAVITLFPPMIAGGLSLTSEEESAPKSPTQDRVPTSPSKSETKSSYTGSFSRAMLGRFIAQNKEGDPDASSVLSGGDSASVKDQANDQISDKPLTGQNLKIATNELCAFLAQTRVQLQRYLNPDGSLKQPLPQAQDSQLEAPKPPFEHLIIPHSDDTAIDWEAEVVKVATMVDTTLFRAYMFVKPTLAGSLFRIDNFCEPDVVKDKLYEKGRYEDLIYFLQGKRLHREALELLAKFGKNQADEEVSEALRGSQRTVQYLKQLGPSHVDIILEFAQWPFTINAENAMEVFLEDSENAETLPRDRVLEFLEKIDSRLAVRYLEHIILELSDMTPAFHQALIDAYLTRLLSKAKDAFQSEEDRARWLFHLQTFLARSSQYNRNRVFRQLPAESKDFYESRAIVLSKLGQHKRALQIYVFDLQDYRKAEEYCNETYLANAPSANTQPIITNRASLAADPTSEDTDADSKASVYHTLLSLYLAPPPPYAGKFKANWGPALDLLSKHGARLPATSTLDLIPKELPIKDLQSYCIGRIRTATSVSHDEMVVKGLRGVEKMRVESALLLGQAEGAKDFDSGTPTGIAARGGGRNRRVVIDEDRHCEVCHKRFGGSAIRVYPDNTVVHYGCAGAGGVGGAGRGLGLRGKMEREQSRTGRSGWG